MEAPEEPMEEDPSEEDPSEEEPDEQQPPSPTAPITAQDFANYTEQVRGEFSEMRRAANTIDGLNDKVRRLQYDVEEHKDRINDNRKHHCGLFDLVLEMRQKFHTMEHDIGVLKRDLTLSQNHVAHLETMLAAALAPPPQEEPVEEEEEEEDEEEEEEGEEEEDAVSDVSYDSDVM